MMHTSKDSKMKDNPSVIDHQEIVEECKGCKKVVKRFDGKEICACHCFPHTKWWFEKCPQATHIKDE